MSLPSNQLGVSLATQDFTALLFILRHTATAPPNRLPPTGHATSNTMEEWFEGGGLRKEGGRGEERKEGGEREGGEGEGEGEKGREKRRDEEGELGSRE